jgi:hypothetical protein
MSHNLNGVPLEELSVEELIYLLPSIDKNGNHYALHKLTNKNYNCTKQHAGIILFSIIRTSLKQVLIEMLLEIRKNNEENKNA